MNQASLEATMWHWKQFEGRAPMNDWTVNVYREITGGDNNTSKSVLLGVRREIVVTFSSAGSLHESVGHEKKKGMM